MKKKIFKYLKLAVVFTMVFALGFFSYEYVAKVLYENKILKEIVGRLSADSRAAEVLVTGVNYDEKTGKTNTTIKFLEYGVEGNPLEPRYFTFSGNIIQFQSLVVRFDDKYIKKGYKMKGKSLYLFWKVFMLDGPSTQEYEITELQGVPAGYAVGEDRSGYQKKIWENFWEYALDKKNRDEVGIKNAQIEAPGTMFVPGVLYTIRIEHDGGLRIDSSELPPILKDEILN